MANRVKVLDVPGADLAELRARVRAKSAPARAVERARIVLLAAGTARTHDRRARGLLAAHPWWRGANATNRAG